MTMNTMGIWIFTLMVVAVLGTDSAAKSGNGSSAAGKNEESLAIIGDPKAGGQSQGHSKATLTSLVSRVKRGKKGGGGGSSAKPPAPASAGGGGSPKAPAPTSGGGSSGGGGSGGGGTKVNPLDVIDHATKTVKAVSGLVHGSNGNNGNGNN